MENLDVLATATQVMFMHNETHGYKTFHNVTLDRESERIALRMDFQFFESVIQVCSLLNLTFRIGTLKEGMYTIEIH